VTSRRDGGTCRRAVDALSDVRVGEQLVVVVVHGAVGRADEEACSLR